MRFSTTEPAHSQIRACPPPHRTSLTRSFAVPVHFPLARLSCGTSFEVGVVSSKFQGKAVLARHRLVHGALDAVMKDIHALSITSAKTPEQAAQAA